MISHLHFWRIYSQTQFMPPGGSHNCEIIFHKCNCNTSRDFAHQPSKLI